MAERRSNDRDEAERNTDRGRSNDDLGRGSPKNIEIREDWRTLNETLERIIRKLSRDEQKEEEQRVRLDPEEKNNRNRRQKSSRTDQEELFRETEDSRENAIQRLEEEKEHLKQLRDKLELLQQDQREKQREEHTQSSYSAEDHYQDRPEPETEVEEQEISYEEFDSDEGFVEKRSKTEIFLLGVLTGMVGLFLINLLMSPPVGA